MFLDVPVPKKDFPYKNKGASLTNEMLNTNPVFIRMQKELMISSATIIFCIGFAAYKLIKRPISLFQ